MKNGFMKNLVVLVLAAVLLIPGLCFARGGGGGGGGHSSGGFGGGRSSWGGGSSGSSSPSSSSGSHGWSGGSGSSSWGSGARSSSGSTPSFGGGRSSSTGRGTAADRQLYSTAKAQGTAFNDRTSAVNSFRSQYGGQYSSRFASEPSTRPSYIPTTTTYHSTTVSVVYNRGYGGYGYFYGGNWIMYDLMADQMMCNQMMYQHGYYYGSAPPSPFGWIWGLLFTLIFLTILFIIISSWWRNRGYVDDGDVVVSTTTYTTTTATGGDPYAPSFAFHPPYADAPPRAHVPDTMSVTREEERAFVPDASQPGYWRGITLGSIISLSDKQAMDDSIKEGRGPVARDYTVREIRTIREQNLMAIWKLFRLQDELQSIWFMAKLVGQEEDLRAYFELPDDQFTPGNRHDLIARGCLWLFQQPANPNSFVPSELQFTTRIEGPSEEGQPPVIFDIKGQGALSGVMTLTDDAGASEQQFATVVEYSSESPTDNPELLLLEIGSVNLANGDDSASGGIITLYQGTNLLPSEVNVLRQAPKH